MQYVKLSNDDEIEIIDDLEFLKDKLLKRMDQYLKSQIKKRGITIIENSYTGFDTEYEHEGGIKNRIVSVQTAIQKDVLLLRFLFTTLTMSHT